MRSAMRADSGSWLTITVVQPCSRTSSPSIVVDLVGGRGVELACRLVREEDASAGGRARRRARRAAARRPRAASAWRSRFAAEADALEQLVGPRRRSRARCAVQAELQRDELARASAPGASARV